MHVMIMAKKAKGSGVEISQSVWRCKCPRTHLFYSNRCDDKSPERRRVIAHSCRLVVEDNEVV